VTGLRYVAQTALSTALSAVSQTGRLLENFQNGKRLDQL